MSIDEIYGLAIQFITGALNPTEWERFKYYANLIQEYRASRDCFDGIALATLHEWTRGQPLLPNLRSLEWATSAESSGGLILFLSPGLRRMRIFFSRSWKNFEDFDSEGIAYINSHATGGLLLLMKTRTPGLEELHISAQWLKSVASIPSFQELRRLTLEDLAETEFIEAACLSSPRLERLVVRWGNREAYDLPEPHIPALALKSLKYLEVDAHLEIVDALLNAVQTRRLSHLVLTVSSGDINYRRICESIATRFSSTLVDLHIIPVYNDYSSTRRIKFGAVFSPLYAIKNLKAVNFTDTRKYGIILDIVITKDDIATMAESWPALERLYLPYYNKRMGCTMPRASPPPPITAFAVFAQSFPRLTELQMRLPDTAPQLSGMDIDALPESSSQLKHLSLRGCVRRYEGREKALRYLARIFPMAKQVEHYDDEKSSDLGVCWDSDLDL